MRHWWNGYPWRMIQTNLREIDMENLDADAYVEELKSFNATVVLLNAAGIIASYDTELEFHPRSKYLQGYNLKKIIERCHDAGIRVIARTDFSKIRQEIYEKHPEWAYRTVQGDVVNYNGDVHTCPNGEYQQECMFEIIKELLATHDFDGIFCNMSGFQVVDYNGKYHGLCHCENCQKKFKETFGAELPDRDDFTNPNYFKYLEFKRICDEEHKQRLYSLVKSINPEIAVNGFDYMRTESNTEIGRAQWQYSASSNSRLVSGANRDRQSDNASVDFMGFRYRHASVSPALMELRQWQNLANAGSVSMYIMGTLGLHADKSGYEGTKKVFRFHKEHEDFYNGLVSAAKVVVMRQSLWERDSEIHGWIRALTESHVPFDEMFLKDLTDISQLAEKEIIILGNIRAISDKKASLIDSYVGAGGIVIATGETGLYTSNFEKRKAPLLSCLGITEIKEIRHDLMSTMFLIEDYEEKIFPRCNNMPYIIPGSDIVMAEVKDSAQKYMKLIPEHKFGPPERCYFTEVIDHPGITVFPYGKGRGIYIPWMIGGFYKKEGYQNTLSVIQDIMFSICGVEELAANLTPMVEINLCKKENKIIIQLINNSGCFANSYFPPIPIYDIQLQLKNVRCCAGVKTLNGGVVNFVQSDNIIEIRLDILNDYEAIVIDQD